MSMKRPYRMARAAWLLGLAWLSSAALAQADEARARKIVGGVCFVCHGMEGESAGEAFARLAGQHGEYIARQLEHFKSGKRKNAAMADMAARLTPDEMLALGKYFEKQVVAPVPPRDKELAAAGQTLYHQGKQEMGWPACASCHGPDARGAATLPRLAGQVAGYTQSRLRQFQQREGGREAVAAHAALARMGPQDMAAVAEYLSSK